MDHAGCSAGWSKDTGRIAPASSEHSCHQLCLVDVDYSFLNTRKIQLSSWEINCTIISDKYGWSIIFYRSGGNGTPNESAEDYTMRMPHNQLQNMHAHRIQQANLQ
ncbi:hypothetical protein VPH35_129794 [Triticum aestivum]